MDRTRVQHRSVIAWRTLASHVAGAIYPALLLGMLIALVYEKWQWSTSRERAVSQSTPSSDSNQKNSYGAKVDLKPRSTSKNVKGK